MGYSECYVDSSNAQRASPPDHSVASEDHGTFRRPDHLKFIENNVLIGDRACRSRFLDRIEIVYRAACHVFGKLDVACAGLLGSRQFERLVHDF